MFALYQSILYHEKGLEKIYSVVLSSKTLTETITIKKLKLNSNMVLVDQKQFDKYDILYTVEKVLKSAIQW